MSYAVFIKLLYFLTTDTPIRMGKKIKGREERRKGGVKNRERYKRREKSLMLLSPGRSTKSWVRIMQVNQDWNSTSSGLLLHQFLLSCELKVLSLRCNSVKASRVSTRQCPLYLIWLILLLIPHTHAFPWSLQTLSFSTSGDPAERAI